MNAIISFFQSIFRSLFGSKTPETTQAHPTPSGGPTAPPAPEKKAPEPPAQKPQQPAPSGDATGPYTFTPHSDPNVLAVDLVRYSSGAYDTLGKLYVQGEFVAYTLEDAHRDTPVPGETRIPAGSYELALRTEGGRHPTYLYRFGDIHKGMLWIKNVPRFPFALICIGNSESDIDGSVLVGTETVREEDTAGRREIWYSEQAYRSLYPRIASHLVAGKPVLLRVR